MGPNLTLTKKGNGDADKMRDRLTQLERSDVLVGIPMKTTPRKGDEINNASLLFIHTNGSPLRNIPARPVIEPAIAAEGNREAIANELKEAGRAVLDENAPAAAEALDRAGLAASNASKAWFTDGRNNWAPNSPETIRRKGSDRPLIDTGALRRAITYVVRQVR